MRGYTQLTQDERYQIYALIAGFWGGSGSKGLKDRP